MMFLKRNKEKFEKKEEESKKILDASQKTKFNLKDKMAKSILLQEHKPMPDPNITKSAESNKNPEEDFKKEININKDKISLLVKKINEQKEKQIVPKINFETGIISFPILSEIGEDESNRDFLESLTSDSLDVLEKTVYEKLLVCPQHPDSFSLNVRLYCPKCTSMEIEKLFLFEHSKCGFISEKKNFEHSKDNKITRCPSCKKEISDMKKELHIPGMWYFCNGCNEKFDDVSLKLHCRNYNHDLEISKSISIEIPGFKIKDSDNDGNLDISSVSKKLSELLISKGFSSEENYSIKGKSEQYHHIDLYGKNSDGKTVFVFIKKSENEIDNSEINSKIIQVLDTSPSIAILIGFATISEKAKTIASTYNVAIVTSQNPEEIISSTARVLTEKLSKLNENEAKT